jgi:signal transduction histidine kinase
MNIGTLPVITVGYIISTVLTLAVAILILSKGRAQKRNIYLALTSICLAIFDISFAIATNTDNLHLARVAWTGNIANIFIVLFYAHWVSGLVERMRSTKLMLRLVDIGGVIIFLACLIWPQGYWLDVVPRLYLKSFIHGGPLYVVMLVYFVLVSFYSLWLLIWAHKHADPKEQNRLKYFIAASIFGYGTGITAFPLTFGVPLDPIFSMLTATFVIPLVYGIVRAEIMDFRVAIKRAVIYGGGIGLLSAILLTINLANNWFISHFPGLGLITIPTLISITAVLVGREIWHKFKETDELKYEFITVAAHKLRTPLTRIKWGIDSLAQTLSSMEDRVFLNNIDNANNQLIRISDVILEAAHSPTDSKNTHFEKLDFAELVKKEIKDKSHNFALRDIKVSHAIPYNLPFVYADQRKTRELVGILLDNALAYTPPGGHVRVEIKAEGSHLSLSVADTGIGITPEELPVIFDRFYRSPRAILIDTEGLGLGLYLARNLALQMGGHIEAKSAGEGLGSTFRLSLKIAS